MRKRMTVLLAIGIICIISGGVMIGLHVGPKIIPITLFSIGGAFIAIYFATRGGTLILDEMVKRVDALSGNYSFIASLFFIFALSIINYFYPLPLSIDGLLLTMMLFMSLSYIFIRLYLLKRGKAE
ncbi:MAG: hypothetical protein Q8O92_00030 [Candidatus Latescibacter sp.]|nr:hypothetical protein [Candidatus Latescibacter sp.]